MLEHSSLFLQEAWAGHSPDDISFQRSCFCFHLTERQREREKQQPDQGTPRVAASESVVTGQGENPEIKRSSVPQPQVTQRLYHLSLSVQRLPGLNFLLGLLQSLSCSMPGMDGWTPPALIPGTRRYGLLAYSGPGSPAARSLLYCHLHPLALTPFWLPALDHTSPKEGHALSHQLGSRRQAKPGTATLVAMFELFYL